MSEDFDVHVGSRRVSVRRRGSPSGRPILYFHGTPESRLTVDCFPIDLLSEVDIQLIAFDRPGYGNSRFAEFSFESIAADAVAILDHLSCDRVALLGHSGGGPFALATAAYYPERISCLGVSSGPGDYSLVPGGWASLTPADRLAASEVRLDRSRAAELFTPDFVEMRRELLGDEGHAFLSAGLPNDRVVIGDSAFASNFLDSILEGLREGVEGCAWDNVAWVANWSFHPSEINVPVRLFYGSLDNVIPISHGLWLQQEMPNAQLTRWDDLGHLGMFHHLKDVLEEITSS